MATQELPPLRRKTSECDVPANRFEGDLFQRSKLADQLTGFLYRLPDGAVIAIDSQWGEGKTWFGRRWNASLQDEGFHTAYIDCFQQDHLDDPFTMIAGELLTLATATKPQVQTKLLAAGKKLGPDGHFKFLHFWPVKFLQAGQVNYQSFCPPGAGSLYL